MPAMDSRNALQHLQTALIWAGVGIGVFLLWRLRNGLLVLFAAALAALLLRTFADGLARFLRLGPRVSFVTATFLTFALLFGTVWLFGSQVSSKVAEAVQRMQDSVRDIQASGSDGGLFRSLSQTSSTAIQNLVSGVMATGLSALEVIVVMIVTAIYLAAEPGLYRSGLLMLVSRTSQAKAIEALDLMRNALVLWLLSQLILMVIVGILTFAAAWLIGLPSAVGLGLIAGIAEVVPYVGPFISAVPAVLIAATLGVSTVVWTIGAYILVHMFEGYMMAPLIQRRFITMPPALVLIAIVFAELIFGPPGALLAAPLAVVVFVAVNIFYVKDTLHRKIELPGENGSEHADERIR